jgi:hypothetical protein
LGAPTSSSLAASYMYFNENLVIAIALSNPIRVDLKARTVELDSAGCPPESAYAALPSRSGGKKLSCVFRSPRANLSSTRSTFLAQLFATTSLPPIGERLGQASVLSTTCSVCRRTSRKRNCVWLIGCSACWRQDYDSYYHEQLTKRTRVMYVFRDEYIFDLEKSVVVEVPQASHATYVFTKPTDVKHWVWQYAKTTRQDIRLNRGNIAESLGFLGRVVHGKNKAEWSKGTPGPNRRASGLLTNNPIVGLDCEGTWMSSAEMLTRVQPVERFGLSPMESEICPFAPGRFYKRKNGHPERHPTVESAFPVLLGRQLTRTNLEVADLSKMTTSRIRWPGGRRC